MRLSLVATLVPALFIPQGSAPSPTRVRLFGKVVGAEGEGIAGARVFFVSRPIPNIAIGSADEVEVRSDDRGRFEARVLDGHGYTVWGQIEDAKGVSLTNVIASATAGRPLQLTRKDRWRERRVRISGRDRWPESRLQVSLTTSARNSPVVLLALDREGIAMLPPLPGDGCALSVRTEEGLHVAGRYIDLSKDDDIAIEIAAPIDVDLTVTSQASGKPLAGAWVTALPLMVQEGVYTIRHPARPISKPMPDGRCRLQFPARFDTSNPTHEQFLLVGAPGHAATIAPIEASMNVALGAGSTLTGRLIRADGRPAAGAQLLIVTYVRCATHPDESASVPPIPVTCSADGRFAFAGLTRRDTFHVFALTHGLGLPAALTSPVHLLVHNGNAIADKTDLGDLELAKLAELELRVQRADGSPATAARIRQPDWKLFGWMEHVTDSRGRLRMLCPPGLADFGASELGGGVGRAQWQVSREQPSRVLRLSEPVPVSGVVVDDKGQPVAGAWVMLWNRPNGPDSFVRDLCFEQQRQGATTGRDGSFRLWAAGVPGDYRFRAGVAIRTGNPRPSISDVIPFTIDAEHVRMRKFRVVVREQEARK